MFSSLRTEEKPIELNKREGAGRFSFSSAVLSKQSKTKPAHSRHHSTHISLGREFRAGISSIKELQLLKTCSFVRHQSSAMAAHCFFSSYLPSYGKVLMCGISSSRVTHTPSILLIRLVSYWKPEVHRYAQLLSSRQLGKKQVALKVKDLLNCQE